MKYELAQLAQRLGLTAGELKNPRVIGILEEHLAKQQALDNAPPEMPRKKPGAVSNSNYAAYIDYIKKEK